MIDAHKRITLLAAIVAGTALMSAGCSDRNPGATAGQNPGATAGQKLDRSADKVAATTERATSLRNPASRLFRSTSIPRTAS